MLGLSKEILCPIRKEGHIFILLFAFVTICLYAFSIVGIFTILGTIGLALTGLCVYFFRDPIRYTPQDDNLVISPADGHILFVKKHPLPPELSELEKPEKVLCVSIFMNVFDVHVNRMPILGKLTKVHYRPGKFLNASFDKANPENERMSYEVTLASEEKLQFVQIAGLVARRILRFKEENATVEAGERVGMIRFGSRVDVYLPATFEPVVTQGQRTLAGETVIAQRKGKSLSAKTSFKPS